MHNTYAQSCPHLFRTMTWLAGLRKWEYPIPYGAVRGVTVSRSALRWDAEHEDLLTGVRCDADVALVYSRRSYVLVKASHREGAGSKDPLDAEYFGWAQFFIESGISYHSLLDGDLTAERLAAYQVLVLPATACLSADAVAAIRGFVASGGRLVAVGPTSRYMADGAQLADFQLAGLFGVHHRGFAQAEATLRPSAELRGELGATDAAPEVPVDRFTVVEQSPDSDVVATLGTPEDSCPGIVTRRHGDGQAVYLACGPGRQTCHVVNYLGSRGGAWEAPQGRAWHSVMHWAIGPSATARFRRVSVPPGVVTNLLTPPAESDALILVHLLNLQATEVEPDGAQIEKGAEVVYPYVRGPLVFDVRADGPCHASMVSPDFDGPRPIDVRPAPDEGYLRLTVPGLVRYGLVSVQPGDADTAPPQPAPIVERPFGTDAGVRLTGAWRDGGTVQRPIGSRPCACREGEALRDGCRCAPDRRVARRGHGPAPHRLAAVRLSRVRAPGGRAARAGRGGADRPSRVSRRPGRP